MLPHVAENMSVPGINSVSRLLKGETPLVSRMNFTSKGVAKGLKGVEPGYRRSGLNPKEV